MPEHVRAKNLGMVQPVPVLHKPIPGRLVVETTLNGGFKFMIVGPNGTQAEELSPEHAEQVANHILREMGHISAPRFPPIWGKRGRFTACKMDHGGMRFKIRGKDREYRVDLTPEQSSLTGYKILYVLGHRPILSPPGIDE